jgi:hypothetical protein
LPNLAEGTRYYLPLWLVMRPAEGVLSPRLLVVLATAVAAASAAVVVTGKTTRSAISVFYGTMTTYGMTLLTPPEPESQSNLTVYARDDDH